MDVTPTRPMLESIMAMADALIGQAPLKIETSTAANKRRQAREHFIDLMHRYTAMSMREGARRALEERGLATTPAPMKNHG